ncbi:hypothetical protein EG329_003141 [Mollisiaceae sp. DMI_Dod_QoI]|nr:hypothetical protein EG329_003141 [Helotiales sp. DMI_Dod_QoI]
MRFITFLLLPLPLLVFSHPIIVEHETVVDRPVINHVDSLDSASIQPRCITSNTPRSLSHTETSLEANPHTTSPHRPLKQEKQTLLSRGLSLFQLFNPHSTSSHHPTGSLSQDPQDILATRTLSHDGSSTISVSKSFDDTVVCNTPSDAKFEVGNNVKNAYISESDNSNLATGSRFKHGTGNKKREYMGFKGWFDSVWTGGDYGRWEMPWRAPTPSPPSAKEITPEENDRGSGSTSTQGFVPVEQTELQRPSWADHETSTQSLTIPKETESQRLKWNGHATFTGSPTPIKTPEAQGLGGGNKGTWSKNPAPTRAPEPWVPKFGGDRNQTHAHRPNHSDHPLPTGPKPGGSLTMFKVVGGGEKEIS